MNEFSWLKDLGPVGIMAVCICIMAFVLLKALPLIKNGGAKGNDAIPVHTAAVKACEEEIKGFKEKCSATHGDLNLWVGKVGEKLDTVEGNTTKLSDNYSALTKEVTVIATEIRKFMNGNKKE